MAAVTSVTTPSNRGLIWLLLSFDGRINRAKFWLFEVVSTVILIIAVRLDEVLGLDVLGDDPETKYHPIFMIVFFATIYPSICILGKRWHDHNKSAWMILIKLIPFVGWLWTLIQCGFLRGTVGDNQFGPDPLDNTGRISKAAVKLAAPD